MANTLPATTAFSSATTETEMQGLFENQRDFVSNLLGCAPEAIITIAAGVLTLPIRNIGAQVAVATEADASTDNLDTIAVTGMQSGQLLLLRASDTTRTVVLRHAQGGSGQLRMKGAVNYSLTTDALWVLFTLRGTDWYEILRT